MFPTHRFKGHNLYHWVKGFTLTISYSFFPLQLMFFEGDDLYTKILQLKEYISQWLFKT